MTKVCQAQSATLTLNFGKKSKKPESSILNKSHFVFKFLLAEKSKFAKF